jgi:hypothetical protein
MKQNTKPLKQLKELVLSAQRNARVGDKVKFTKDGRNVKYGKIVELYDCGAKIYNQTNKLTSKSGEDYDVSPDTAEWYPFVSKTDGKIDGGIVLLEELHPS